MSCPFYFENKYETLCYFVILDGSLLRRIFVIGASMFELSTCL